MSQHAPNAGLAPHQAVTEAARSKELEWYGLCKHLVVVESELTEVTHSRAVNQGALSQGKQGATDAESDASVLESAMINNTQHSRRSNDSLQEVLF